MIPMVARLAFVDVVHSPDDGGWYAEVYNHTGKTLHTTGVYPRSSQAEAYAIDWCRANRYHVADTMHA
jgi:hypothetical protein